MKATKQLIGDEEMALTSPGVEVSVIDESFYTPAEPGTRPLIIIASAENKTNVSGTGIAAGTLASNAGRVYLLSSQRDLADTFGDPTFRVDSNNNPIHAGELNEYGLQAAYSFLGVSNSVFVIRADLDLGKLEPQADAPTGRPNDGTFWLDTATTAWGVFQWNAAALSAGGQSFSTKTPTVITDATKIEFGAPKAAVGSIGDYAITVGDDVDGPDAGSAADFTGNVLQLFYKSPGNANAGVAAGEWVAVGSDDWKNSTPAITGSQAVTTLETGDSLTITAQGVPTSFTSYNTLDGLVGGINGADIPGVVAAAVNNRLAIYLSGDTDSVTLAGTSLAKVGMTAGLVYAPTLVLSKHTQVPQWKSNGAAGQINRPTGSIWIKTTEPNAGARVRVKQYDATAGIWIAKEAPMYASNASALV
jgi:hypothetical protein